MIGGCLGKGVSTVTPVESGVAKGRRQEGVKTMFSSQNAPKFSSFMCVCQPTVTVATVSKMSVLSQAVTVTTIFSRYIYRLFGCSGG